MAHDERNANAGANANTATPSPPSLPGGALPCPLRGILAPLATPLRDRDRLDVAGLERLVEHVLAGGVRGVFVLGTTGEAPSLSYHLRHELIGRVCRQVADRVPVLVGVTDSAFVETVRLARFAADAGAHAVVVAAPYYFPAGAPELQEYLKHLAPEIPTPIFLYNMPSHTKIFFDPPLVQWAADLPQVVGIKDSSADMIYFHRLQTLLEGRPDFSLLVGPEELLGETVLLGGHGGVNGGANLFPSLYVALYRAAAAADRPQVARLHAIVLRISMTIYSVGRHGSSYLKGLKCALALKGIIDSDFMAEPFHRFRQPERAEIARHLADIEALIANALPDTAP